MHLDGVSVRESSIAWLGFACGQGGRGTPFRRAQAI